MVVRPISGRRPDPGVGWHAHAQRGPGPHVGAPILLRVVALGAVLAGFTGCSDRPKPGAQDHVAAGLSETAERDGVVLTVTTDRAQARVADPVRLTVEVRAPSDTEFEFPDVGHTLKDFIVRDHGPVETRDADGRRVWRQWLVVESNLSGPRVIPGVSLTVGGSDEPIATEPLTIEVPSAIEGETADDPTRFADIEGPVAIPQPRRWMLAYVGLATALALAALVWVALRRQASRARAAAPPPPPHVWAVQQLDLLLAQKLVERGLIQEFYYRLSGIVRTYIELRFALMAPERTTEEFLVEVQRSDALRWTHKDLLGQFLTACDLVKFARHEPRGTEIDASIDAARGFITQTAPKVAEAVTEAAA